MFYLILLSVAIFCGAVEGVENKPIKLNVNNWKSVSLDKGITRISTDRLDSTYSSVIIQATALHQICVSIVPECKNGSSYYGKSVGIEQFLTDTAAGTNVSVYVLSNVTQEAFVLIQGYTYAPLVGACPESALPLKFNPNLEVNQSNEYYNVLSFAYSTLVLPNRERTILKCNDKSYWPQLIYEVYILPWNQRYIDSDLSFNESSIYSLPIALQHATSSEVVRYGSMIHNLKKDELKVPKIRIIKRLGLDMIVSVVVRINDESYSHPNGKVEFTAFYVSDIVLGCSDDDLGCAVIAALWAKVLLGIFAVFCFFFSHLGRRFHRLNILLSGFAIGSILTFSLLTQFSVFDSVLIVSLSLTGGGLAFGLFVMLIFWKSKPNLKLSYLPLYITASFLLSATVFFTPLGNQSLWSSFGIFCAGFFVILGVFSVFVFLPLTEKFSVDFCVALIGSYGFIFGVMAIFVPGSVFPYLLLDSLYRVGVPNAHNALTVSWSGNADLAAFIAWPLLVGFFLLINRFCSPALSPRPEEPANALQESHHATNWSPVDTWPPLPPAAYVSERTPLLAHPIHAQGNSVAEPPPYMDLSDRPPSYRP